MRRDKRTAPGPGAPGRVGIEWIGGLLRPPFFVTDHEEPYRPELAVWMELPTCLIVGHELVPPSETRGALSRALLHTLEQPLAGSPRRPDRVRVADASLAPEIREALGGSMPVKVAPTPELDEMLGAMLAGFSEEDSQGSYLVDGHVPPESVEGLFKAAKLLHTIKPWKTIQSDDVLRLDIPWLGVEGGCVSVIGGLGENLGVLVFPSHKGFEAFLDASEDLPDRPGPIDLGTEWIALEFVRGADLPDAMRREVAEHGWPVAGPDAYPVVQHWDPDGVLRPPSERDVAILGVCARSLCSFFVQNEWIFSAEEFDPVSVSYFDGNDREVRFTYPYEAYEDFEPVSSDPNPRARSRPKVSRNAPCPCGSGLKYKKCHLPLDQEDQVRELGISRYHGREDHMVQVLMEFAEDHFRDPWSRLKKDFKNLGETLSLAVPWSLYVFRVAGRSVADAYLETRGKRCPPEDRVWLAAQKAAWLSVWEVTEVDPGKTVTLHDLLSDESRLVTEVSGSRTMEPGHAVLARVVDHEGVSLLCGLHPRPLSPLATAEIVRRARGRLKCRQAVPVDRLRDEAFGRYLIKRWEEAVAKKDATRGVPPALHNTDGDPILLTTDRFEIAPGVRSEVEARLAAMEGTRGNAAGDDPVAFDFIRPGGPNAGGLETVLVGRGLLSGNTLTLETNSLERADALRKQVEVACGDRLRHRGRVHADPMSSKAREGGSALSPGEPTTPEMDRMLREYKERHYADWVDQPLPALAGKTPREAVRIRKGREAVYVLLKEMEHQERQDGGAAFDFSGIRSELGLP